MNKVYKKLPLHKTTQNIRPSLHSFVIARHKERNGNTTYINLKNLQNSRNTFFIQKGPSCFTNLSTCPCLLSFVKKRMGGFVRQKICFFTSSFSPTHLNTGQYRVSLFILKSIFIIKKNVFLYVKEHALIFFCRYLWVKPKKPT